MKLTWKWLIWFIGIGVYVMCLGGVFYYNLFNWTFDERLKTESITMIRNWAPLLQKGLSQSPWVITMDDDLQNPPSEVVRLLDYAQASGKDEDAFKKDETFIRAMVRFRIDEVVFGIAEAQRHLLSTDPQSQVALSMFGEAVKLTELSRANGRSKAH